MACRYVRKHIAGAINMRMTPEIRFIHDDSIQRGEEVRSSNPTESTVKSFTHSTSTVATFLIHPQTSSSLKQRCHCLLHRQIIGLLSQMSGRLR